MQEMKVKKRLKGKLCGIMIMKDEIFEKRGVRREEAGGQEH